MIEVFPKPEEESQLVPDILQHLISPGQEVGGDSRLVIPSNKNVVTASEDIGGQVANACGYAYLPCQKRCSGVTEAIICAVCEHACTMQPVK